MSATEQILRPVRRLFSGSHVGRRRAEIATLFGIAVGLQIAAGVGLAYWAGFHHTYVWLGRFQPIWLAGIAGGLALSFFGYVLAYRGVFTVHSGKMLDWRTFLAVVAAGFGGFLARGGSTLDKYALEGEGFSSRDANARVSALAGMEHGVLGIGGWAFALVILAIPITAVPFDIGYPWAIIPIPGFAIAFWAASRYRDRLRGAQGWRRKMGIFLDAVHHARTLFLDPAHYWFAPLGMAIYWAADAWAVWCGLRAFGLSANVPEMFIGFATGMVFTRRTGPLAGAGVLTCTVPLAMWYCGVPLAPAVVGFFTYEVFSLWLPLPFSVASLPTLRRIGESGEAAERDELRAGDSGSGRGDDQGEPALREAG